MKIKPFSGIRPSKKNLEEFLLHSTNNNSNSNNSFKKSYYNIIHGNKLLVPKFNNLSVKTNIKLLLSNNFLVKDNTPSLYVLSRIINNVNYTGIIALSSVVDFINNKVKIHEKTIKKKEKIFADYLESVKINSEPVLLVYKKNNLINNLISDITNLEPIYDFEISGNKNKFWKICDRKTIDNVIKIFSKVDEFYLADGHHRINSSKLLYQRLNKNILLTKNINHKYFMSFLISHNSIKINSFNRILHNLNDNSKPYFLKSLSKFFIVDEIKKLKTPKLGFINMYFKRKSYSLFLKNNINCPELVSSDTHILKNIIFKKILTLSDTQIENNISFKKNTDNIRLFKKNIDCSNSRVGFVLKSLNFKKLKKIIKNKIYLPPKSTMIEPKLINGLVIYDLEK
tara:strand:+ start:1255 stop:2448 length:1194 start_codon:yes stop_codon:yes gene_type:complete